MNEEENTINCPECSSKLLDDVYKGEIVCSGCGIVVEEQTADYGPESISSDPSERMKLARATGQTTFSQHDYGSDMLSQYYFCQYARKSSLLWSGNSNAILPCSQRLHLV